MKLLVLGSTGQLGSDLLRSAARRDVEAEGLDRSRLDLAATERIEDVLGALEFDALVNCAAHHGTDRIEREPGPAFAVNAHAVERIAAACGAKGAAFVQVSSDYVFSGDLRRPYREADPPAPINVYGASKLMGERLALRAHPAGTRVVRTASLFGLGPPGGPASNFVEAALRVAGEGGTLRVVDDVVMSPTSTADLAGAILALLASDAVAGVYHLVNAGEASWHDFARAILERAGLDARLIPVSSDEYGATARRPGYSVLNASKAAALGVTMRDWRDALGDYLEAREER